MSPRTGLGQASVVAAVVLPLVAAASVHAGPKPIDFTRPLNAFDAAVVERARAGAVRRL